MPTFKKLEDIIAWQKARNFHLEIKKEIKFLIEIKDFELKEQLKSSSGSVMGNIAEGFGRMGNIEFKNFPTFAHGSLQESLSQIYRMFDYNYITEYRLTFLNQLVDEISRLIHSLIDHIQSSEMRGNKFK